MQAKGASRASRLIVLGGGIVQDIGTFCAHVYYRGIPYEYVPTTLLSMADSSIGAKCAVNLGAYKNQLGFFQSPSRVLQWPGFLETLSPDDVRSGYGEILKLSITGGRRTFEVFEEHLQRFGFATGSVEPLIALSLGVKKPVIEADEYDRGIRKTLNYGHTFGHALESVTDHQVPHGLAVAWGVDLANFVAWRTGMWTEADFLRIHELVGTRFSTKVRAPYDAGALVAAMGKDKKATGATVQCVLPDAQWKLQLVPQQLGGHFQSLIEEFVTTFDPFARRAASTLAPGATLDTALPIQIGLGVLLAACFSTGHAGAAAASDSVAITAPAPPLLSIDRGRFDSASFGLRSRHVRYAARGELSLAMSRFCRSRGTR